MRICMLSWEYPPRIVGGIARHVEEISEAMAAQGHEIHVITADHPNTEAYEHRKGVHIHRIKDMPPETPDFVSWVLHLNFGMADQAIRMHQHQPFDLVHAHDWLVSQAGILLKKALGVPLVATIHATEAGRMHGIHNTIQSYINQQEWRLSYEAFRVIVCSEYMRKEVKSQFGVPDDKLDVIPNGIDYTKFDFDFDKAHFRRRFALDHEKIVLFVGRMVPEKGAQVLVEAMPRVLAGAPEVKFVVVGKGGFLSELKARAAALNVGNKALFTGYVDDDTLLRLYKVADVSVVPSLYEPFGIVALEGMGAKLPTVVAQTGGLGEIVDHTQTGITTYAGDAGSLAWGLLEVLKNPEYAQMLGQNAFRKVEEVFNWPAIARTTVGVYDRTLEAVGKKSVPSA